MQQDDKYTIRTASDNEELALVKLQCINCNAPLEMSDRINAKCPYCGQKYKIEEADGKIINITVDYGDSIEVKQSIKNLYKVIGLIAGVMIVVVFGIIMLNS